MNNQYNPFRTNKFQQGGILQNLKDWWLGREGSEENPYRLPEVTVAYPSKEKIKNIQKYHGIPQTGVWDDATKKAYNNFLTNNYSYADPRLAALKEYKDDPIGYFLNDDKYVGPKVSDYPGENFISSRKPSYTGYQYKNYVPGHNDVMPYYTKIDRLYLGD